MAHGHYGHGLIAFHRKQAPDGLDVVVGHPARAETAVGSGKGEMLNGYARDFFGATILRWDELENMFWRELWQGF